MPIIPIEEHCNLWEEIHVSNRGNCRYHDYRFREDWIPIATTPFSPAFKRFKGNNKLAKKIVDILENDGKFVFREGDYLTLDELKEPLEEIMFHIPLDIQLLIRDYSAYRLMLDRKSFSPDGQYDKDQVRWYIQRAE